MRKGTHVRPHKRSNHKKSWTAGQQVKCRECGKLMKGNPNYDFFCTKCRDDFYHIDETIKNLDPFEERMYLQQIKAGQTPLKALEVMVNTVEGDDTQLSPALKELAVKKGWLIGYLA